jgi:uncharacterized protein (DUF427 family)
MIKMPRESVWDYPRPPKLEKISQHIRIIFNEIHLVESHNTYRVLETSHPPGYYIPQDDILMEYLIPSTRKTYCEWKGEGSYYHIQVGNKRVENAAWFYSNPTPNFISIKNYLAFYPGLMDSCWVDNEKVVPQPGSFYGGWITSNLIGPFKGIPGSQGW